MAFMILLLNDKSIATKNHVDFAEDIPWAADGRIPFWFWPEAVVCLGSRHSISRPQRWMVF